MPLKIVNLFNSDLNGMAIKSMGPGNEWAMLDSSLMTIKLDSITVEVGFDSTKSVWTLKHLRSNGLPDFQMFRSGGGLEAQIWQAFDNQYTKQTGKFLVYGKDINGNPHGIDKTLFAKFMPITHELVVQAHKTIVKRGPNVTVGEFYDSIYKELEQSPEIQGLVFHKEDSHLNVLAMAKVTRQQMGLEWPVKPEQTVTQVKQMPVTSLVM